MSSVNMLKNCESWQEMTEYGKLPIPIMVMISTVKKEYEKVQGDEREAKGDRKSKHWRLIIRNLPFSTTKTDLQNVFSKFGSFSEIVLPPCKDPRYPASCAGFAFVQFIKAECAKKALNQVNGTKINGRVVAVDFAVPKDTFESDVKEKKEMATSEQKGHDEDEEEDDDVMDEDDDEMMDEDEEVIDDNTTKQIKRERNNNDIAVAEERVLFLRNLSFDATDESLKDFMSQFGHVTLAIVCRYSESKHSKGTAFVHFAAKEHADKALASAVDGSMMMNDRRVLVHRAIQRFDARSLQNATRNNDRPIHDKRNLHLQRVSIIRQSTITARHMSDGDARRRTTLAMTARKKLENLHMFVSPNRLVVHNLPKSLTDAQLRAICLQSCSDVEAEIVECRIWREVSADGQLGNSKGFAFVAFIEHSHALKCLQAMNNNPDIFSNEKRPIVEFSIENMVALRQKKSRSMKNVKNGQQRGEENEKRQRNDTEATKRALSLGGQKPFPAKFGPKIRHSASRTDARKVKDQRKKSEKKTKKTESKKSKTRSALKFLAKQ